MFIFLKFLHFNVKYAIWEPLAWSYCSSPIWFILLGFFCLFALSAKYCTCLFYYRFHTFISSIQIKKPPIWKPNLCGMIYYVMPFHAFVGLIVCMFYVCMSTYLHWGGLPKRHRFFYKCLQQVKESELVALRLIFFCGFSHWNLLTLSKSNFFRDFKGIDGFHWRHTSENFDPTFLDRASQYITSYSVILVQSRNAY